MSNEYPLRVRTARLELVAGTLELANLEIENISRLAEALECPPPASWPPPLNDEHSQRWYLAMLKREPQSTGWALWYILRLGTGPRELIGSAGFKGRPQNGACEIGYSVLPPHHGCGYATEAAAALVAWAFAHREIESVTAETLPGLTASIRVMEKCGMRFVGDGNPEEGQRTVRYAITRNELRVRQ